MLDKLNLDRDMSRDEYEAVLPSLQRRLYDLEKACWDNGVPSVVVFEGWDSAGKGGAISAVTQRLDPRGFKLYSIELPRTFESHRPWLYRFWLKTPNRGEMVILDHSWYTRVLLERVDKLVPEKVWSAAYQDITDFERMLVDDGTVMIKFFLHISKKEQKRRFKKILEDPLESWRINKEAWRQHKHYDDYVKATEQMLERTDTDYGPWTIVEATSRWFARKKIFDTIIAALEKRLGSDAPASGQISAEEASHDADLRQAAHNMDADRNGAGADA